MIVLLRPKDPHRASLARLIAFVAFFQLIKRVAEKEGLIGVGFRDAICDTSVEGIVNTLRYAIDLAGEDHIAPGSDFDAGTKVSLDTSELSSLTDLMMRKGFTETEIRKVMGENYQKFLLKHLPEAGKVEL